MSLVGEDLAQAVHDALGMPGNLSSQLIGWGNGIVEEIVTNGKVTNAPNTITGTCLPNPGLLQSGAGSLGIISGLVGNSMATFIASADEGSAEVSRITPIDDNDHLDQKYFKIYDGESTDVAFWIDLDGSGSTEPLHGATRSTKISTINKYDTASIILNKLNIVIGADGKFDVAIEGSSIKITEKESGKRGVSSDGGTGFEIVRVTPGVSPYGTPSPELISYCDAICEHIMILGKVKFPTGKVIGTCTNTPLSPGAFIGTAMDGEIEFLVGTTLAALVQSKVPFPFVSPELINKCTALVDYIMDNAEVSYDLCIGTAPAGGGPLLNGAATNGKIE